MWNFITSPSGYSSVEHIPKKIVVEYSDSLDAP